MIWGRKKSFFEKTNVNFVQKRKNTIFRNFCGILFGRKQTKSDDLSREGLFDPQNAPIFSITDGKKLVILSRKNILQPPKKRAFFGGKGDKKIVQLLQGCLRLLCIFCLFIELILKQKNLMVVYVRKSSPFEIDAIMDICMEWMPYRNFNLWVKSPIILATATSFEPTTTVSREEFEQYYAGFRIVTYPGGYLGPT